MVVWGGSSYRALKTVLRTLASILSEMGSNGRILNRRVIGSVLYF